MIRPTPPKIVIAGRPNVGKSTLFNALAGRKIAIEFDRPGTTRDSIGTKIFIAGREIELIDTAGLEFLGQKKSAAAPEIDRAAAARAEAELRGADFVILVVDGATGAPVDADRRGARIVRAAGVPAALVATHARPEHDLAGFARLGLGAARPVELGARGRPGLAGIRDFLGSEGGSAPLPTTPAPPGSASPRGGAAPSGETPAVAGMTAADAAESFEKNSPETPAPGPLPLLLLGRPNAGKSTLWNRLTGTDRAIVSAEPGTTRDVLETEIAAPGGAKILLRDAAGVRRAARVGDPLEKIMVARAARAIRESAVVLLLFDGPGGIAAQDKKLANLLENAGAGVVLGVNKWDEARATGDETLRKKFEQEIAWQFPWLAHAPVVFFSGKTGWRADRILPEVLAVAAHRRVKIPTSAINKFIQSFRSRIFTGPRKIKYAVQTEVAPPRFVAFLPRAGWIDGAARRHFENALRAHFDLAGVPIFVEFRGERDEKIVAGAGQKLSRRAAARAKNPAEPGKKSGGKTAPAGRKISPKRSGTPRKKSGKKSGRRG